MYVMIMTEKGREENQVFPPSSSVVKSTAERIVEEVAFTYVQRLLNAKFKSTTKIGCAVWKSKHQSNRVQDAGRRYSTGISPTVH